jgi:SPOR domain
VNAWTLSGRPGRLRRAGPGVVGVVLAVVLVCLGFWLMERPLVRGHGPDYQHRASVPGATQGAAIMSRAGIPAHVVEDLPGASRPASPYAVTVGHANTEAGAILRLQQVGTFAPAGTYEPTPGQAGTDYQIVAGAFATSNDAEALLRELRAHGQVSETSGTVVHVPLAFLIERDVAAAAAAARVAALAARGLPVYALRQADGRAWLYAGAFASAADAALLGTALRTAGVPATLAYRTGRPF